MGKLDRYKTYIQFLPSPLKMKEINFEFVKKIEEFSGKDLGRGLLNHELYHLTETLSLFDEENIENSLESQVELSHVDNFILTASLKFFLNSKLLKQSGNWSLLLPSTAYAYPLLLTYHLILQHLGESLVPTLGARFNHGSGVLIVTDNIELHSHVWRTTIANNFLRKFIDTYTIKGNKFTKFNLMENDSSSELEDGSLPWLCFYRAVRHELFETFEKAPEIIILDLIPLRHRHRAQSLIDWAKKHCDHVVIVAPLFDEITYTAIKNSGTSILPVDPAGVDSLRKIIGEESQSDLSKSVTAAWSLKASQSYLARERPNYYIHNMRGMEDIETKINEVLSLVAKNQSFKAIKKLVGTIFEISNLIVPLNLYEQLLASRGKPSLISKINSCEKIMPEDEHERRIYQTILPLAVKHTKELYSLLKEYPSSPRGEAISQVIQKYKDKKILVITSNKLAAHEFKVWLRVETGLTATDLSKLSIISQDEWITNQLREVYFEGNTLFEIIIMANVWKQKYLSSFLFTSKSTIHCISFKNEEGLYKYQINKVNCTNQVYHQELIKTFVRLTNSQATLSTSDIKPIINKCITNVSSVRKELKEDGSKIVKVDDLFDEETLLSMITFDEDEENEVDFDSNEFIDSIVEYDGINSFEEFLPSVKVTIKINSIIKVVFVEQGTPMNIVRNGNEDIISVTPLELNNGDIWVKIKGKQRRELFETILELASNTMVMKWIQINVSEWREMIKILWQRYHHHNSFRKNTYIKIMQAVNQNGGNVDSYLTISNWVKGEVSAVRDEKNVKAVAYVLGDPEYIKRWQVLYKAMRTLWNIHIKLGKILGKVINETATKLHDNNYLKDEWIDLGMDIKLPLQDVFNALDLVAVSTVDIDRDYYIHQRLLEKQFSENEVEIISAKGWLKDESL